MTYLQPRSPQPSQRLRLSTPRRHRPGLAWHTAPALIVLAFLVLSLGGCDSLWDLLHTDGDAEAQIFVDERQRVRTFLIETDSLSIETNDDGDQTPTVQVNDSVTEYTMNSSGIVRFNESGGGANQRFDVETGDRIIERPGNSGTGTLTIIDSSPPSPVTSGEGS